jgi:predicted NBD/HSP70 family sugar kinase
MKLQDDTPAAAPARATDLRRNNLAAIMRQVARNEDVSRAELAALTGLTKGTISVLVQELLDAGLVVERGRQAVGQVGRPRRALAVNGDAHGGVGLEIGVDHLSVYVMDVLNRSRYQRIETVDNRGVPASVVLDRAARLLAAALAAAQADVLTVTGACVAVPGMLHDNGHVLVAPNLGWSQIAIVDELRARLDADELPLRADNEANVAALAELWLGEGAAFGDYIYVSAEIGIGAGIVIDGRLFRGARGFAGELGHVVVDPGGPACSCGGRGCLERIAGQEAILASAGLPTSLVTSVGHTDSPLPGLERALREGVAEAVSAVEDAGRTLGVALSGVVNVLDIETVVVGGIYPSLAPWLLPALEAQLDRQIVAADARAVRVHASGLGADASVRGAAACVVQQFLAAPG